MRLTMTFELKTETTDDTETAGDEQQVLDLAHQEVGGYVDRLAERCKAEGLSVDIRTS
jgi:hypothetical protein